MSSEWERLREAARELRRLAAELDEPMARVRAAHRGREIWTGPAADRFFAGLTAARQTLDRVGEDLIGYATVLEREADARESQYRLGH